MKKYILSIDQGTTSSRVIIFDEEINIISIAQKEFPSYYPQPGWVEQNADEIYSSVVSVIYEALAKGNLNMKDISAIGISNQRETTIVWDKATGKPVYFALVWQSRQTSALCDAMKERGKEEFIQERTGLIIDSYFSSSKIRWILDKIPNGQERAERGELLCGTVDSWLVYRMTNGRVHVTDVSNASRTQLMNLKTLNWDKELCALWDIPMNMLPEIKSNSEIYGMTALESFGAEVPIAALVGDQQASLFGQACFHKGDVKNTYGTGCFLLMNIGKEIQRSSNGLVTTVAWKVKDEVDYALEGSVFVAGAAIQWLRDGVKLIKSAPESEERAESVSSTDGVYVVPAFVGLGAPYWDSDVKGAIFGLTRGTSDNHIIRATLESLAYQTHDVLKAMENDTGVKIETLKVDGGASRNNFLMQFQSDLLQAKISRSQVSETTSLGAAFLAGLAVGVWKDTDEISQKWRNDFEFEPQRSKEEVEHLLNGWHKAVRATQAYK